MNSIQLVGRITENGKLEIEIPAGIDTVRVTLEPVDPEQAWFWTDHWQKQERKVDKEIAQGHYKDFENMDDFINDLLSDEWKN